MRWSRTRHIKWLVLVVLSIYGIILLTEFSGLNFGKKSHSDEINQPSDQSNHNFKLKSLDVGSTGVQAQPSPDDRESIKQDAAGPDQSATDANGVKNSAENEAENKKASSSLSGERTHGLSNANNTNNHPSSELMNSDNPDLNITSILSQMHRINQDEPIRNEELFGPVTNETLIIVIQVHNRIQYLRHLIVSLSQAKEIEKALIIFSHDFWDEGINELIASIDFAKTLQIFYPLSIQTHPNQYPGESPNDCPRNAKKDQAVRLQCTNAEWPDLYGHYREAKYTQTKHHWWWKANRIFDQLKATRHFDGLVLFLEEDHFVAEDFIVSLRLAEVIRNERHPEVDIICVGTYLKTYNYYRDHKTLELTKWASAKHNMGMAFNRNLWTKIYECRQLFCSFDDYNWDWSLEHISNNCIKEGLQVLLFKGPRVFHIGECGVHHKKHQCSAGVVVQKVRDILSRADGFLYPQELTVTRVVAKKRKLKPAKGNGGWGDHRDHQLCLRLSSRNETMEQLEHWTPPVS